MISNVPQLRFVSTPNAYFKLLRMNMQKSEKIHQHIKLFVEKNKDLQGLILNGLTDIDEHQRLDKILVSLGWFGLRDRLAAHYLYYQNHNSYAVNAHLDLVEDILKFEKRFISYTVEGYSRSFMLGLYLKMQKVYLQDFLSSSEIFAITDESFEILSLSKIKTLPIDWLTLSIEHFKSFYGKEELHRMLLDGCTYEILFEKLNDEQQYIYLNNMVVYGASIGEQSPFLKSITE